MSEKSKILDLYTRKLKALSKIVIRSTNNKHLGLCIDYFNNDLLSEFNSKLSPDIPKFVSTANSLDNEISIVTQVGFSAFVTLQLDNIENKLFHLLDEQKSDIVI